MPRFFNNLRHSAEGLATGLFLGTVTGAALAVVDVLRERSALPKTPPLQKTGGALAAADGLRERSALPQTPALQKTGGLQQFGVFTGCPFPLAPSAAPKATPRPS